MQSLFRDNPSKVLNQASLVQDIWALCSQRQFLSTRERRGSDVAKKKHLKLILLIGQWLAHNECVGWGFFLNEKTLQLLRITDLKALQTLPSLISSQLLHICWEESHTLRKTEKRGRWVSNWMYHDTQEFHINEVQGRNQESNIKHKKELSHKWFLTKADSSDRPNTIPVWSIKQGSGEISIHGDVMYTWEHGKVFLCFKDFA